MRRLTHWWTRSWCFPWLSHHPTTKRLPFSSVMTYDMGMGHQKRTSVLSRIGIQFWLAKPVRVILILISWKWRGALLGKTWPTWIFRRKTFGKPAPEWGLFTPLGGWPIFPIPIQAEALDQGIALGCFHSRGETPQVHWRVFYGKNPMDDFWCSPILGHHHLG